MVAALCLGVGLGSCAGPTIQAPAENALIHAFLRLHTPIYDVYGLELDGATIHNHLARSFRGDALTSEYVEHFSTLSRMASDSTSIRVLRVDYESLRVLSFDAESGQTDVEADWSVGGIVRHQEHRHPRTNRYRAIYRMAHDGQVWRLEATRLRDMNRVRRFEPPADGKVLTVDDLPKSGGGMMSPSDLLRAGMDDDLKRATSPSPTPGPSETDP